MTTSPPADATVEQALAWPGPAREATNAHPLCVCGKPTGKRSAWVDVDGHPVPATHRPADCPMHAGPA